MPSPVKPVADRIAARVADLAGRVHGHRLPPRPAGELPTLPACTVRLVSAAPSAGSRADVTLSDARVQVSVFASTDGQASQLHDAIRGALDRAPVDLSGSGLALVRCLPLTDPVPAPATADPSAEGSEVVHWAADFRLLSDRPGPRASI